MLSALRRHPLLVAMAEVLLDAIRYFAVVLVLLMLLAQAGQARILKRPG